MNLFGESPAEVASGESPKELTGVKKKEKKVKTIEEKNDDSIATKILCCDYFFENEALLQNLKNLFTQNKLPNALLVEGGIECDKLTFAYNLCLDCIAISLQESKESVYSKFQNNIIDDILIIKNKGDRQILIDEIRNINDFVLNKSYFGNPKFIIIDSIDSVNINGVNCLLKNLEEPQDGIFFILLYNKIEKILPTIISRCIRFKFKHLSPESFGALLKQIDPAIDVDFYSKFCDNSIVYYDIFTKNDAYSFCSRLADSLRQKNYIELISIFGALEQKIKENNHLMYRKIIILKLFTKIFLDIYSSSLVIEKRIEKYDNYLKFFQRLFDKNLNLNDYSRLIY